MKKYLLTLLFVVACVVNSLAGGNASVLETDKLTLEGYRARGFMTVLTADGSNSLWSPFFISDDEENKIYRIKGVNENGIVDIAEIKYDTDHFQIFEIRQEGNPDDFSGGICIGPKLDWLNSWVLDEKIDVDFNYLFSFHSYNGDGGNYLNHLYQLVNERGDVIYTFPQEVNKVFYSKDLFYISYTCSNTTGEYPNVNYNYTSEVINLASLLKDYSTRVANAKADAVNSKSTKPYNIQGMEVDEDAKGIIIENGTKYIKE